MIELSFIVGVSAGMVISWLMYRHEIARLHEVISLIRSGAIDAVVEAGHVIAEERQKASDVSARAREIVDVELGRIGQTQREQYDYFVNEIAECHKMICRIRTMCQQMADGDRYMDSVQLAQAIQKECEKTGREAQRRADAYAKKAKEGKPRQDVGGKQLGL